MTIVNTPKAGKTKKPTLFDSLKNWWFVKSTDKSVMRIFQGYGRRKLAVKYADKRHDMSKEGGFSGGKIHYVLSFGDNAFIVANRKEVGFLKDKGYFKPGYNIEKLLNNAFYIAR